MLGREASVEGVVSGAGFAAGEAVGLGLARVREMREVRRKVVVSILVGCGGCSIEEVVRYERSFLEKVGVPTIDDKGRTSR